MNDEWHCRKKNSLYNEGKDVVITNDLQIKFFEYLYIVFMFYLPHIAHKTFIFHSCEGR